MNISTLVKCAKGAAAALISERGEWSVGELVLVTGDEDWSFGVRVTTFEELEAGGVGKTPALAEWFASVRHRADVVPVLYSGPDKFGVDLVVKGVRR